MRHIKQPGCGTVPLRISFDRQRFLPNVSSTYEQEPYESGTKNGLYGVYCIG